MPDVRATCRTVPGLTREQLELCYRASDVTAAAIEGLELGVRECQHQFQWHRWNCSSLSTKSRNPHTSSMLKRGKIIAAVFFPLRIHSRRGLLKIRHIWDRSGWQRRARDHTRRQTGLEKVSSLADTSTFYFSPSLRTS